MFVYDQSAAAPGPFPGTSPSSSAAATAQLAPSAKSDTSITSTTGVTVLPFSDVILVSSVLILGVLLAGIVVVVARSRVRGGDSQASVVRSWIAIMLVLGLLVMSVVSFGLNETTLRSALVGGLTASVGSAIAFYFSSKSADQARQDVLTAAGAKEAVPKITGQTTQQAQMSLGLTSLKLDVTTPPPAPDALITGQHPAPGTPAPAGSSISPIFAAAAAPKPANNGGGLHAMGLTPHRPEMFSARKTTPFRCQFQTAASPGSAARMCTSRRSWTGGSGSPTAVA